MPSDADDPPRSDSDGSSRSEGGSSRSEGGSSRSEGGSSRSEGGSSRSEGGSSRSDGGSSRSDGEPSHPEADDPPAEPGRSGPDDRPRPPANVALDAVPYAVPFAGGLVFLVWGTNEVDRVTTTYYGDVPHLFGATLILVVGSILFLYASAGAFAAVRRSTAG